MSQAELLSLIVAALNDLQIAHMLVGSHASSFYGEARSTHDIDLVIDLDPIKIPALVSRFDPDRYDFSVPESARPTPMPAMQRFRRCTLIVCCTTTE